MPEKISDLCYRRKPSCAIQLLLPQLLNIIQIETKLMLCHSNLWIIINCSRCGKQD